MRLDVEVKYIDDIQKAIELGVMSFPVLAINGKPIIVGMIPSVEEIKETIINYQKGEADTKKKTSGCSCIFVFDEFMRSGIGTNASRQKL